MNQEPARLPAAPGANHNWPLIRQVVGLLRKSSVGLTPSTLLELILEADPELQDEVSRRGTYQRVLRALQQLETMGIVVRSGRRYILQVGVLEAEVRRTAAEAVDRFLRHPGLVQDPEWLKAALVQALDERIESLG